MIQQTGIELVNSRFTAKPTKDCIQKNRSQYGNVQQEAIHLIAKTFLLYNDDSTPHGIYDLNKHFHDDFIHSFYYFIQVV